MLLLTKTKLSYCLGGYNLNEIICNCIMKKIIELDDRTCEKLEKLAKLEKRNLQRQIEWMLEIEVDYYLKRYEEKKLKRA